VIKTPQTREYLKHANAEAKTLLQLEGAPNILQPLDIKCDVRRQQIYIVFPRLVSDLYELVVARHDQDVRMWCTDTCSGVIAEAVTNALAFVHAKNICHGDVKMENIGITGSIEFSPEGSLHITNSHQVMLFDWDASHDVGCQQVYRGTPSFYDPDALAMVQSEDHRPQDVWALGLVFFMLLMSEPFSVKLDPVTNQPLQCWRTEIEEAIAEDQTYMDLSLRLRDKAHTVVQRVWQRIPTVSICWGRVAQGMVDISRATRLTANQAHRLLTQSS
jgi:serine/threonine protein kinase